MASEARIFFAGLGASLVCLALVLVLGRPGLDDSPTQTRASSDPFSGMRVIVPAAAEPAMAAARGDSIPQIQPAKDVQAEKQVEGENKQLEPERPKTKKEMKAERRKKQAERRLKKKQAQRVRQRPQLQTPQEPAIMAVGGKR
jgi:hypothetical protein